MLYLHSLPQPLVHRDLSSNNVLIDRRGNAKICDFGLSRQMALSTEGGSAAPLVTTKGTGTAEYTAPEILRIGSGMPGSSDGGAQQVLYSEKVDVYSFGTLLWEILTRRVPWQHAGLGTLQVITQLAIRGSAATVATLRMDAADPFRSGKEVDVVPPQLVELIHACFSDDPQLRPGFEDIVPVLLKELREAEKGKQQQQQQQQQQQRCCCSASSSSRRRRPARTTRAQAQRVHGRRDAQRGAGRERRP